MDFTPVVHDHEEELVDPRDFLPPSFFTDSNDLNASCNSFVEPPSDHSSSSSTPTSSTPTSSPLNLPEPPNLINRTTSLDRPLTPQHISSMSSPTPSSSCGNTSALQQATLPDDEASSSPVPITNFPDRPRPQDSNRRQIPATVPSKPSFTRVKTPVSPDQISATSPESVMHYPPKTARLMRMVTNGHFRVLGAKGSLNRKKQPTNVEKMH